MSDAGREDRLPPPLVGGRLLAEITNRIVAFMREHYGRGPTKAKSYVLDNLIVCVLSDEFTAIERTLMEGGEPHRPIAAPATRPGRPISKPTDHDDPDKPATARRAATRWHEALADQRALRAVRLRIRAGRMTSGRCCSWRAWRGAPPLRA
jgi:Na+-translocating membrane potential-generating system (MpsC)